MDSGAKDLGGYELARGVASKRSLTICLLLDVVDEGVVTGRGNGALVVGVAWVPGEASISASVMCGDIVPRGAYTCIRRASSISEGESLE